MQLVGLLSFVSMLTDGLGAQPAAPANNTPSALPSTSAEPVVEAQVLRARQHFRRGVQLFNQGDNEGALAEFRSANELVYHPKVWFNIAMVLSEMNQPVEAVDAFDRALAGSEALDEALTASARTRRDALQNLIGTLEISSNTSGAAVRIDGIERGTTPLSAPIALPQGRHVVELSKADHDLLRRELNISGRGHFVLEVVMKPHVAHSPEVDARAALGAPPPQRLESVRVPASNTEDWRYPTAYTAFGLGGAGLVLAGVAVVAGRSLCPDSGCPPNHNDRNAEAYENWRTTAVVAVTGAAIFGAAGLVLVLTAPDTTTPSVSVALGAQRLSASLRY